MSLAASLIQRKGIAVTRLSQSVTTDAGGSPITSYVVDANGPYTMFVQPKSGSEVQQFGADRNTTMTVFYAAVGVPVVEGDRLRYSGTEYTVTEVRRPGEFGGTERTAHLVIEATRDLL